MYIRNPETNVWEEVFLPPTGDTYPIGMYGYFAGNNAPTNWLRCDGQEVSRTDYVELFNTIGTTYGSGNGATTFNLPNVNLENRTLVGSSGDGEFSLGNTGGEKEHVLTVNEMPSHTHDINPSGATTFASGGSNDVSQTSGSRNYTFLGIGSTGGDQPHNNMQPFMASVCCIKAKQSVGVVGTVTSDINDTNDNAVPNAKTVKDYVGTDTDWVDLPLNTGVSAAVSKYRKIGKMVEVIITNLTGYEFQETFVTLPEEIRPTYGFRCICPSSATSYVRLEVYSKDGNPGSGSIYPDKKGAMHIQNSSSGNKEWTDINITYFI
nr:MAG TPA: tail collar domain [Caudoviricetes sp.]